MLLKVRRQRLLGGREGVSFPGLRPGLYTVSCVGGDGGVPFLINVHAQTAPRGRSFEADSVYLANSVRATPRLQLARRRRYFGYYFHKGTTPKPDP